MSPDAERVLELRMSLRHRPQTMEKSATVLVPVPAMTTTLVTVSLGAMSSLVMVQLFTSPKARVMVPSAAQSPVMVAA